MSEVHIENTVIIGVEAYTKLVEDLTVAVTTVKELQAENKRLRATCRCLAKDLAASEEEVEETQKTLEKTKEAMMYWYKEYFDHVLKERAQPEEVTKDANQ